MNHSKTLIASIIALVLARHAKTFGSLSKKVRVGSLFSGIGGFDLGIHNAFGGNVEFVFFCENNPDKVKILKRHWPDVPIYSSIESMLVNEKGYGILNIDMLIGGFPCQDLSSANTINRTGFYGDRSSLYFAISELVDQIILSGYEPPVVIFENVANIKNPAADRISPLGILLGDMNNKNYVVEYQFVNANNFGSPQKRRRFFGVCYHRKPNMFVPEDILKVKNPSCSTPSNPFVGNPPPILAPKGTEDTQNLSKRIKMLGDSVIPSVAEWVGKQVLTSGVLAGSNADMFQPVFPFNYKGEKYPLDPYNTLSIPNGGLVHDWIVYPGITSCFPRFKPTFTMPTVTTVPNLLAPSMQKWAGNKAFRRRAGLLQGQAYADKGLAQNISYYEWVFGYPKGWTKL